LSIWIPAIVGGIEATLAAVHGICRAGWALTTRVTEGAQPNTVANLEFGDIFTHSRNNANEFVTWNDRIVGLSPINDALEESLVMKLSFLTMSYQWYVCQNRIHHCLLCRYQHRLHPMSWVQIQSKWVVYLSR
jgi:hypothetical protein